MWMEDLSKGDGGGEEVAGQAATPFEPKTHS